MFANFYLTNLNPLTYVCVTSNHCIVDGYQDILNNHFCSFTGTTFLVVCRLLDSTLLNVNLQSHLHLKDSAPGAGPTLGFHFQCVQLRDDHKHQAGVIPWVRLPTNMLQTIIYICMGLTATL